MYWKTYTFNFFGMAIITLADVEPLRLWKKEDCKFALHEVMMSQ